MTIQELFEEYANIIYNLRVDPKYHYGTTGRTLEGIIQEVEALVRKDTMEEILQIPQMKGSVANVQDLKKYAQSKGITL